MSGTQQSNIQLGCQVRIVQKQDQQTGRVTERIVKDPDKIGYSPPWD